VVRLGGRDRPAVSTPKGRGGRPRSADPERIDAVIEDLGQEQAWRSGLALGELGRRWPEVVGERLAVETRPAALDRGLLVVAATSSGWAAQVRFLSGQIRREANQLLGAEHVQQVKVTRSDGHGMAIPMV
jgi:predicted nucleic acid-binding Zn ribbon protein